MKKEEWRAVIKFEGVYEVSSFGRVRSLTRIVCDGRIVRGRLMKTYLTCHGYEHVGLRKDGVRVARSVHSLVLTAFTGSRPDGEWARHYPDPSRTNNSIDNLLWGTPKENSADRTERGSENYAIGERHGNAKLTLHKVSSIRKALKRGVFQKDLAEKHGVSQSQISKINLEINWA